MLTALGWGALAASSLLIGALLALVRGWSERLIGLVLAFGAGALISAVSFELALEGTRVGSFRALAAGLALGAIAYYLLDGVVERLGDAGRARERRTSGTGAGGALALGAFLDGIPEQLVLGIGLAGGEAVSVGLLTAIFVSNLPEAIGSASAMRAAGRPARGILALWIGVAACCALATLGGFALGDAVSGELRAGIDGFAAGALLVMLVDSMIPDATEDSGRQAGLVTVLGFALAAALSIAS
ncbi:MAG: ZIP family metal transporter [Conexibacter sp.]